MATESALRRDARLARRWVVRAFRWHAAVFVAVNVTLALANFLSGNQWWAFWPLMVTGFLLGLHYLFYKVATVDERWAEERVEELNLKSYDRSHIEDLKSRHER
jgi:hypothetical protein